MGAVGRCRMWLADAGGEVQAKALLIQLNSRLAVPILRALRSTTKPRERQRMLVRVHIESFTTGAEMGQIEQAPRRATTLMDTSPLRRERT